MDFPLPEASYFQHLVLVAEVQLPNYVLSCWEN